MTPTDTQIPVMGWIAIGTFAMGLVWSVLVWSLGRYLKRHDQLEEAVNGKGGLRDQVNGLITRGEFEKATEKLEGTLEVINDEGHQRERRLLEAIGQVRGRLDTELRDIQREVDSTSRRVDSIDRRRS